MDFAFSKSITVFSCSLYLFLTPIILETDTLIRCSKNSEIKHRHGYDVVTSSGLIGMKLQGALTIFTVNLK